MPVSFFFGWKAGNLVGRLRLLCYASRLPLFCLLVHDLGLSFRSDNLLGTQLGLGGLQATGPHSCQDFIASCGDGPTKHLDSAN